MKNKMTIGPVFMVFWLIMLMSSCSASRERKSAKYYFEHEKEINSALKLYKEQYRIQPFNLGFSDRDFKNIGIDIMTDTVRYAINNLQGNENMHKAVEAFRYDIPKLVQLYETLFAMKCLWLGKDDFYHNGKRHEVIYFSYKSALLGNPFLDRKYYNLVFFEDIKNHEDIMTMIEKAGFKHVKGNIYFKTMERFR